jgi:hypothetical protein
MVHDLLDLYPWHGFPVCWPEDGSGTALAGKLHAKWRRFVVLSGTSANGASSHVPPSRAAQSDYLKSSAWIGSDWRDARGGKYRGGRLVLPLASYCSDAMLCGGLGLKSQKQLHADETTKLQQCPRRNTSSLFYQSSCSTDSRTNRYVLLRYFPSSKSNNLSVVFVCCSTARTNH